MLVPSDSLCPSPTSRPSRGFPPVDRANSLLVNRLLLRSRMIQDGLILGADMSLVRILYSGHLIWASGWISRIPLTALSRRLAAEEFPGFFLSCDKCQVGVQCKNPKAFRNFRCGTLNDEIAAGLSGLGARHKEPHETDV